MTHDTLCTPTTLILTSMLALAWLPACTDDTSDAGEDAETTSEDSDTGETAATETGDESETGSGGEDPLEIIGEYMDNFGDAHTITEAEWQNSAGSFAISNYDNVAMYLIAQNASTNQFSPDLWSRFDWTWNSDQLFYCQSVFDAATPEDAEAGGADVDDLESGCGGFSWSMLTPQ